MSISAVHKIKDTYNKTLLNPSGTSKILGMLLTFSKSFVGIGKRSPKAVAKRQRREKLVKREQRKVQTPK